MIDARRVLRWLAAAVPIVVLAACSVVGRPPEEPARTSVPPSAPAPQQPTAPAPLTATPPPPPTSASGPGNVALIMPISGKLSSAGISLREGFMTAYYQAPAAQRLHVRFYDTAEIGVGAAVAQATRDGAELIVGPLAREAVSAAASIAGARPPILALNFLPPGASVPGGFYQFALSPEDEARQVARRVLADGHRGGVALVPTGDWGARVLAAFTQELQAGGGTLLSQASFDAARSDYSFEITQVLRINDSLARDKRLEAVLGTKLVFQPRLRGDIEFIFAASQANTARLLLPQLRFHFAGSIATYATSDSFEPHPTANQDLEGLMIPDMPWMLGGELADTVHDAAHAAWPTGGPHRTRLYAFGYDAYLLAAALHTQRGATQVDLQGLTGHLSLDAERRVQRELVWGSMHNGQPRALPAAAGQ
jgi:outer membrane PBP1 activator LpoA protein